MSKLSNIEKIKNFHDNNFEFLKQILSKLEKLIKGKRKIMYSDIINYVIRKGNKDDDFNQLILWCNYKIRCGDIYVEFS